MAGGQTIIELLREIRDELRNVRSEVKELRVDNHDRFDDVRTEIRASRSETAERFGLVETALLDLVEQQHFVARYTRTIAEHDTQLDPRLSALETLVRKLDPKG
jgi:hypothetical protein